MLHSLSYSYHVQSNCNPSDNVPVVERVACRVRAQVAGAAVAGVCCFFVVVVACGLS